MVSSEILARLDRARADYEAEVLVRYRALKTADDYSHTRIDAIRDAVTASPPPAECQVLAVAGSLARLEASEASDLDLIMTMSPDSDADAVMAWRDALCAGLEIDKPNPKGVFYSPAHHSAIESISGFENESYQNIAQRVLFILESEWIHNQDGYSSTIDKITESYTRDVKDDPKKNFVFLLNDVIRFFRAVCLNYQFNTAETADGKWPIRNIKLRHSRVIMYFSMVLSIGLLSKCRDAEKIDCLKTLIKMTPLERIFFVYKVSEDDGFYKVFGFYNSFLGLVSKPDTRDGLKKLEYADRYDSETFSLLKSNSDALASELFRFYETRRAAWSERFFEYMLL